MSYVNILTSLIVAIFISTPLLITANASDTTPEIVHLSKWKILWNQSFESYELKRDEIVQQIKNGDKIESTPLSATPSKERLPSYGGSEGNKIFTAISSKVIVPNLTEFFTIVRRELQNQEDIDKILPNVIYSLGVIRRDIAILTNSDDAKKFGQPSYFNMPLLDYVSCTTGWEKWTHRIQEQVMLLFNKGTIHLNITGNKFLEDLENQKEGWGYEIISDNISMWIGAKIGWIYRLKCNENKTADFISVHRTEFNDSFEDILDKQSLSALYHFQWQLNQEKDKDSNLFVFSYLKCEHLLPCNSYKDISGYLYRALRWDHTKSHHELSENILGLLWEMSHFSIYRGQAAVTLWKLNSLIKTHHLSMQFPSKWFLPYDQEALSELCKDKFIKENANDLIFTSIADY